MNHRTILIVDADPLQVKIISDSFLEILPLPYNYKVINASNAQLGLKMANSEMPDLIVADLEITGLEFGKALKKNPEAKAIPMIVTMGHKMSTAELDLAISSGAIDFIRKPIDKIELLTRARIALEMSESKIQLDLQRSFSMKQRQELYDYEM